MKSWIVLAIAVAVGMGVGAGSAILQRGTSSELFFTEDYVRRAEEGKESRLKGIDLENCARVEVDGDAVYDFGSMERYSKKQHVFKLKSVGKQTLDLKPGRTTCKCTVSKVSLLSVPVGEVSEIVVEWTGQTFLAEPDFMQTIEVETNDPNNPRVQLKIKGYVTETIRALPEELAVGAISSNSEATAEFRLYGFRSDVLEVRETTWENAELASFFEVKYEPLSAAEVAQEKGATCGVVGRVSIKPGLPLGPINQTIRVRASAEKEAVVDLPILGRTQADIRIAASPGVESNAKRGRYDSFKNLLVFGALRRTEPGKAVLQVYVTGPHRTETQFSVGTVEPAEYLKVDIGPPKELNYGRAIQYLVTIEIPAGLAPVNHLGGEQAEMGRIVLETTHPLTKRIPIQVSFSVE
jgi:hypothetical protein